MRLVEFNGHKFSDDVAIQLCEKKAQQLCLRKTGISNASLSRIVHGHVPIDITTILSLCAYLNLRIKDYILV